MGAEASLHRYPARVLLTDYVQAAIGLVLCVGLVLGLHLPGWLTWVLLGLALLFGYFALVTAFRHWMEVRVSEDGIAVIPFGRRLGWNELTGLSLRYYSTSSRSRRHGIGDGWMQLELRRGLRCIKVDSRIDGFEAIAAQAARAATRPGPRLSDTTLGNFRAMGIRIEPPGEQELSAGGPG